ncbi:restriction endonuclease subunit S [Ligilactobacillus salivarius]
MDNKKNGIPKLRFPEFTGAWEQRKFSEFATYSGKRNKDNLDLEPYAITSDNGFIRQSEAHNEFGYMKNTDRAAYKIVQSNSFGYNPARINIGSIGYYSGDKNIIVSSLYEVFKTNQDVNDEFLWIWFKSNRFQRWINKLQEGSVRLYFYYDKLRETKIQLPNLEEQRQVADLFTNLDSLIALHQRKLEHLQEQKKGLLQKMFPKNGETVPEVRFPGFTDAWEQRKFSEFATYSGKRNKDNLDLEPYAITSDNGFIRQSEAHNEFGYMKNTDRAAYKIVQSNSFGYNPARINIGSIGYYSGDKNIIVSSLYEVFKTNQDVNDEFLWIWFKSNRFQRWINKLQEGSVRLYFYYDKLRETKIQLPNLEEQRQVADLFTNLDSLIALHQRKLEHLELMKKGLLQQMFV